ncbi:hypothetical protein TrRE_jg10446, partial [Triparma retinervis]
RMSSASTKVSFLDSIRDEDTLKELLCDFDHAQLKQLGGLHGHTRAFATKLLIKVLKVYAYHASYGENNIEYNCLTQERLNEIVASSSNKGLKALVDLVMRLLAFERIDDDDLKAVMTPIIQIFLVDPKTRNEKSAIQTDSKSEERDDGVLSLSFHGWNTIMVNAGANTMNASRSKESLKHFFASLNAKVPLRDCVSGHVQICQWVHFNETEKYYHSRNEQATTKYRATIDKVESHMGALQHLADCEVSLLNDQLASLENDSFGDAQSIRHLTNHVHGLNSEVTNLEERLRTSQSDRHALEGEAFLQEEKTEMDALVQEADQFHTLNNFANWQAKELDRRLEDIHDLADDYDTLAEDNEQLHAKIASLEAQLAAATTSGASPVSSNSSALEEAHSQIVQLIASSVTQAVAPAAAAYPAGPATGGTITGPGALRRSPGSGALLTSPGSGALLRSPSSGALRRTDRVRARNQRTPSSASPSNKKKLKQGFTRNLCDTFEAVSDEVHTPSPDAATVQQMKFYG